MLASALRQIADEEAGYQEACRGMLADLRKGYNLGTKGRIDWKREAVHER